MDHDLRGRVLAHYFLSELEKIAYSKKTQLLYHAAGQAQKQVEEGAKALGVRRLVPFTQEHRAYFGHVGKPDSGLKGRARQLANAAEKSGTRERAALLGALASGKGNRAEILKRLQSGPQRVGPVQSRARALARAAGAALPVEQLKQEQKSRVSPIARRALAGAGLLGAGAGAAYAGQQYLTGKEQGYY